MGGCDSRRRLLIDLETYSDQEIGSTGVHRYVESPSFEILLLAYAWDDGPVRVIDIAQRRLDGCGYSEVICALTSPDVVKVAHNSAFERACLSAWLGFDMPAEQWEDTMVLAAWNGLPLSLDACGAALALKDQKIKEGTTLITYFCKPCKPTVANGGRTRNFPHHAPDKWARFCEYCKRDVEVEQAIYYRLRSFKMPAWEREVFCLDARINERGVMVDTDLARAAVDMDADVRGVNLREMAALTGLENPNSVAQLTEWLTAQGVTVDSLNKETIAGLLKTVESPVVRRVLELRQQIGKTSVKKYDAMLAAVSPYDQRVRGMMQYYGAHTGRFCGRLVQVQNLPQNHLEDIGEVRDLVKAGDTETVAMMFPSVPDVLSQLIRTALVARPGHRFLVADYSAIEARVTAYLAGVKWRMDTFRDGGDIYCTSASQMFHVPVVKHGENGHLRAKGKVAELACGFGGGVGALKNMGGEKMGLSEEEMADIVRQWRAASPEIPRMWRAVEDAARAALSSPGRKVTVAQRVYDPERARANERLCGAPAGTYSDWFNGAAVCTYYKTKDALLCRLPSGRCLSYWGAVVDEDGVKFMAQNQTTRKWEWCRTFGGRLVENIVQAYARDLLAHAMLRLDKAGYNICFSVHDEVIVEEPDDGRTWKDMAAIMAAPVDWAPGLILRADGYETKFYMKD